MWFGVFFVEISLFLLDQKHPTQVIAGPVLVPKAEGAGRAAGQRVPGRVTTSDLGAAPLSEELSAAK